MSAHTAGRLEHDPRNRSILKLERTGVIVAQVSGFDGCKPLPFFPSAATGLANARRLRACWNAMSHLSTEQVDKGADLVVMLEQRAELLGLFDRLQHIGVFYRSAIELNPGSCDDFEAFERDLKAVLSRNTGG